MKELITFISELSFEDQHFWVASDEDERQWQFFWVRSNTAAPVKIIDPDSNCTTIEAYKINDFVQQHGIDADQLRTAISETIMTMACFANTFIGQARSLLGDDVIDEALESYAQFSDSLMEIVQQNISNSSTQPKLTVMEPNK